MNQGHLADEYSDALDSTYEHERGVGFRITNACLLENASHALVSLPGLRARSSRKRGYLYDNVVI